MPWGIRLRGDPEVKGLELISRPGIATERCESRLVKRLRSAPSGHVSSTGFTPPRSVLYWLLSLYALVGLMVAVGGITRLTGSGLSMVEWQPLIGAIPPLNAESWQRVFDLYRESPQYQQVNHWMGLEDFKRIFLWEYLHRLLGRSIGLVCFVPWVYFLARGQLRGRWAWTTFGAFVLGGMQGVMGWLMVKSGLVDVPAVSHLRLAAHLSLAFLVGMWLLWIALDLTRPEFIGAARNERSRAAWALLFLLSIQVVYGAFMAGTRAGYMYSTFPTMHGAWVAPGWLELSPAWLNLFENPAAIHMIHRHFAWVVVLAVGAFVAWALPRSSTLEVRRLLWLLLSLVIAQLGLGALTVMSGVQIGIAVSHQVLAYFLVSLLLVLAHRARDPRSTLSVPHGSARSPP